MIINADYQLIREYISDWCQGPEERFYLNVKLEGDSCNLLFGSSEGNCSSSNRAFRSVSIIEIWGEVTLV